MLSNIWDAEPVQSINLNNLFISNEYNIATTLDFSWYAPFREFIHGIILAFVYLFVIVRLLKNLPNHIQGNSTTNNGE